LWSRAGSGCLWLIAKSGCWQGFGYAQPTGAVLLGPSDARSFSSAKTVRSLSEVEGNPQASPKNWLELFTACRTDNTCRVTSGYNIKNYWAVLHQENCQQEAGHSPAPAAAKPLTRSVFS